MSSDLTRASDRLKKAKMTSHLKNLDILIYKGFCNSRFAEEEASQKTCGSRNNNFNKFQKNNELKSMLPLSDVDV